MKNKIMKRISVIVAIALAFGALDGTASAATLYAVTGTNTLLQFDSATPATITRTVAITGLATGSERVLGIDFRPRTGQLFAVTIQIAAPANGLLIAYRVNPHSGVATFVGLIPNTVPGAANVASGFDFNPTVDRIRIVNANDENFRVNPNSGSLSGDDTDLNPSGFQVIAESYDRNWNRANATTVATTLYGISRAASSLVLQGGLNGGGPGGPNGGQITTVGPLGVTLDAFSDAGFDIHAGGTAYAALTVGGLTGLYSVNLTTGAAMLVGTIGTGTTAVTGLAVVPRSLVVVGPGEGGSSRVRVFDAATGVQIPGPLGTFFPFPGFRGGVRVALGDVTSDGVSDIIAAAGPGGSPHVRVFDGRTGAQIPGPLGSFLAFTPGFRGGVNVAAGDVDGDGYEDVIVGAGEGGNPRVRVFSGLNGAELLSFFAYVPAFRGGVRVAAADFNLDGRAEIITAAGPGGGPRVRIFDGTGNPFVGAISNSFLAFDPSFHGGVFVAAGDIDGDGVPDVVAGADADAGFGPHVKAISGNTGALILSFFAYSASFRGGVRVAVADVTGDGIADVITGAGPGGGPHVRSFSIDEQPSGPLASFFAYPASFRGGVYVGATRR